MDYKIPVISSIPAEFCKKFVHFYKLHYFWSWGNSKIKNVESLQTISSQNECEGSALIWCTTCFLKHKLFVHEFDRPIIYYRHASYWCV